MQVLNQKELEQASEAVGTLLIAGVPLLITYRLTGDVIPALPLAFLLWFGARALAHKLRARRERRHELRLDEARARQQAKSNP